MWAKDKGQDKPRNSTKLPHNIQSVNLRTQRTRRTIRSGYDQSKTAVSREQFPWLKVWRSTQDWCTFWFGSVSHPMWLIINAFYLSNIRKLPRVDIPVHFHHWPISNQHLSMNHPLTIIHRHPTPRSTAQRRAHAPQSWHCHLQTKGQEGLINWVVSGSRFFWTLRS